MKRIIAATAVSLGLAAAAGGLVAAAVGASKAPPATKTVTVTLTNGKDGKPGPPGPPGPKGDKGDRGPSGAVACPAGFVHGLVVVNHPGGQVTIYGCIQ